MLSEKVPATENLKPTGTQSHLLGYFYTLCRSPGAVLPPAVQTCRLFLARRAKSQNRCGRPRLPRPRERPCRCTAHTSALTVLWSRQLGFCLAGDKVHPAYHFIAFPAEESPGCLAAARRQVWRSLASAPVPLGSGRGSAA